MSNRNPDGEILKRAASSGGRKGGKGKKNESNRRILRNSKKDQKPIGCTRFPSFLFFFQRWDKSEERTVGRGWDGGTGQKFSQKRSHRCTRPHTHKHTNESGFTSIYSYRGKKKKKKKVFPAEHIGSGAIDVALRGKKSEKNKKSAEPTWLFDPSSEAALVMIQIKSVCLSV